MARRAVINGKVQRAPSLGAYDNRRLKVTELHSPHEVAPNFKAALSFDKDYPSTRSADKALLIALGVDGDVPLEQARINSGLDMAPPANENFSLAIAA